MPDGNKNFINFTNEIPNDQGSYIPNNVVDFTRYNYNPVILRNHDWHSVAIGMMRDIHFDGTNWKGLPDFHGLNDESKLAKAMYEKGYLVSASIGGEMMLKTTGEYEYRTNPETSKSEKYPVYWKDDRGLMEATKFTVFEISFPTLPSNYLAVTDGAISEAQKLEIKGLTEKLGTRIFTPEDKEQVFSTLTTLSIGLLGKKSDNSNINQMADEKEEVKTAGEKPKKAAEKSQKETSQQVAEKDNSNHVILAADEKMPKIISNILKGLGMLGSISTKDVEYKQPDDDDKPQTLKPKGKGDVSSQPTPTGMSAEKAKKEAEEAVKAVKEAKAKYEEETDEDKKEKFKKEYEKACKEAEEACKSAEEAEEKVKAEESAKKEAEESAKKEAEEEASKKEAEEEASKKRAEESAKKTEKMSAQPLKKTQEELAKLNLAPKPEHTQKITVNEGVTFTKLQADKGNGERILGRIFNGGQKESGEKTIADYAVVLNAIMADKKYEAVLKQLRIMPSANHAQFNEQRTSVNANPNSKAGFNIKDVAARLNSGRTAGIDFTAGAQPTIKTTLSTEGSFSSLDTTAVEWLTLILYKLFPSEDWKNEIPIFGAESTGRNLGVIWTNILANAPIYRGTNPSPAGTYGPYSDQAVGMSLIPYWQEPTLWQPLSMHQLRYDQMASGWIQNLAALNAQIGDDLLYTLMAGLYANQPTKIVKTGGWGNAVAGTPQTFTIPGSGSSFIFNSSFAGTLVKPGMNDIFAIEELFALQNYDLPRERPVLVTDSSMMRYLKSDPQTQSMLTRWVNEQGAELQKISHTLIHERSRVGAFDPASTTVIDTHATNPVIPSTTQSAGLAFIASQVAIGLGLIDVFMIQDPNNYGYKMSVDLRINARALRKDYTGLAIYNYDSAQGQ